MDNRVGLTYTCANDLDGKKTIGQNTVFEHKISMMCEMRDAGIQITGGETLEQLLSMLIDAGGSFSYSIERR